MYLDGIFSSRGKIKILRLLIEVNELNITQIYMKTGINYKNLCNYLNEFIKIGILKEKRIGRMRFFSINKENEEILKFIDFIKKFEEENEIDKILINIIKENPMINIKQIIDKTGFSYKYAYVHLKKLIDKGIVIRKIIYKHKKGRPIFCYILPAAM
jgi:predicted transcriptional regulator